MYLACYPTVFSRTGQTISIAHDSAKLPNLDSQTTSNMAKYVAPCLLFCTISGTGQTISIAHDSAKLPNSESQQHQTWHNMLHLDCYPALFLEQVQPTELAM